MRKALATVENGKITVRAGKKGAGRKLHSEDRMEFLYDLFEQVGKIEPVMNGKGYTIWHVIK